MDRLKPCHQGSMYSLVCIGTATANHSPYQFAWCFLTAYDASLRLERLLNGVPLVQTTPGDAFAENEGELQWIWNGSGG